MIAAIVQARMGSTRLPGKVLRVAAGKTFLEHLLERLQFSQTLEKIIVATSELSCDDPIADLCQRIDIECFRGSERDVLDRYYQAACFYNADDIVRITADCPLIDPNIVDDIVNFQQENREDYDLVTNRHPLTFPDGLDVDVMSIASLKIAWEHALSSSQREHVIPYFWESNMRVYNYECEDNLFPYYRWTVDYEEDAILVEAIFEALYLPNKIFGMKEILQFLKLHPELGQLNRAYLPVK